VPGSHEVTCIVTGTFGAEATTEAYTFENRACRTLGDCDENRVCSTFATMGTSCNDNDECSENDQCNDLGVCLGTEIPNCGEETTGGETTDTGTDTETETTGDDDDTTTTGDDDDDTTGTETDTDAGTETDTDGGTGTETDAGTDTTTTGGDDDDDTTTGGTTGGTSTIPDQTEVPFTNTDGTPGLPTGGDGCSCSASPKDTMPLSGGIWLLLVAFVAREYRRAKARKQARGDARGSVASSIESLLQLFIGEHECNARCNHERFLMQHVLDIVLEFALGEILLKGVAGRDETVAVRSAGRVGAVEHDTHTHDTARKTKGFVNRVNALRRIFDDVDDKSQVHNVRFGNRLVCGKVRVPAPRVNTLGG
jgi:hypothetical protein